jgi:hypothetical protein
MAKRFSTIYGAMFILVGLMGLIGTPLIGDGGFFRTNAPHDWTHILIGAVLLWAGQMNERTAYASLMGSGTLYALLALMGYAAAGPEGHAMLLGLVHINGNDNWLHVLLAVVLIVTALATRRTVRTIPAH